MQKLSWLLSLIAVVFLISACQSPPEVTAVVVTDDPRSPMKIDYNIPANWPSPSNYIDSDEWLYAQKEFILNDGSSVVNIFVTHYASSAEAQEVMKYEDEMLRTVLDDKDRTYPDSLEIYEIQVCGEPAAVFERREQPGTTAMSDGETFNIDVLFLQGSSQYSYTLQVDLERVNNYRTVRKEFFDLVESTTCP